MELCSIFCNNIKRKGVKKNINMLYIYFLTWDNGIVDNWERSASKMYVVTLLI